MKKTIWRIFYKSTWVIDFTIWPFVLGSAIVLNFLRRRGIKNFPLSKKILLKVGVLPVTDHYYEPLFNPKHLRKPLSDERILPGIDWNLNEQLATLKEFNFQDEFKDIPDEFASDTKFYFKNGAYLSGDAEYWYNMIRLKKPRKIIEIGSGH